MVGRVGGPGDGGKVGGPKAPSPPAPSTTEAPARTSFADALRASEQTGATEPTAATGDVSPLERLRRGEIDLASYVDVRVREATAHLEGVLAAADLEKIRADLSELIENDPDVAELVKAAGS